MSNHEVACEHCSARRGRAFAADITMAFQPIFDLATGGVFAQEALLRGRDGRGAGEILSLVNAETIYSFDQLCRTTAIEVASSLGLTDSLSINFMPNAVYEPDTCIRRTLRAADAHNFPVERIIFEFTEAEQIRDIAHLRRIVDSYRAMGFRTALDDFGAGYAGLGLLAEVVPDIVKLDRKLITGIDADATRRVIVSHTLAMCRELGVEVIAEGIETAGELSAVRDLGVSLVQGFHLGRPRLDGLQTVPLAA